MINRVSSTLVSTTMQALKSVCGLLVPLSLSLLLAPTVVAQQVPSDPTSTHIFPAGGQRGTTIDVRVGGECLPPLTKFHWVGTSLKSPEILGDKLVSRGELSPRRRPGEVHIYYPKEWQHTVDIASDAPLGMHLWRVACARGGTGGRPFIVGDLPEFFESESNSTLESAQQVVLPVTLNGQIEGERDLDYFQFEARADEVVHIEVASRRLGSPLEPLVEVYDDAGQRVGTQLYRAGSDPVIALHVPKSGRYRIMIGHLGFQGGPHYVYRATLSTTPFVPFVFPSGGQPGATSTYEAFRLGRTGFESFKLDLPLPHQVTTDQWITSTSSLNLVHVVPSTAPDVMEAENNNSAARAQSIEPPTIVHGRFLEADDEDWFQFKATQNSMWTLDCRRFPDGGDCLPIMTITDAAGAPLATANMAEDPRRSCQLQWRAPADGSYCIRLRDIQQGARGGVDFIYRLSVRPAQPTFELDVAADNFNVVQGSKVEIEIKARRSINCDGEIELQVEGLPRGVSCAAGKIPAGASTTKLQLVAEEGAQSCAVPIAIVGRTTADTNNQCVTARAVHLGHDSDGISIGAATIPQIQLTVRHKPAIRLYCNEAYQYAYRGSVYPYLMEIERLNGFTGRVHIEMADRQIKDLDGIEIQPLTIEPGQTQFQLPLYLPETMHINVQAHSNVYAQGYVIFEDASGQKLSQLFVSEMRCMIRPLPTVAKLSSLKEQWSGAAGETVECSLQLDRTSLFDGPMTIELVDPPAGRGLTASPVVIGTGVSSVAMLVKLSSDFKFATPQPLKFRATGQMPGYVGIVSEATAELVPPKPIKPITR